MSGTARTTSYLLNTTFAPTGAPGRITPQSMDDLVASGPQWDAPSGVVTPYLMRGTWDGTAYMNANGGAIGSGQTTLQRQTNATVLQGLINSAVTNGKFLDLPLGTVEFYSSAGIVFTANGAGPGVVIRGNPGETQLVQFYPTSQGAPVVTIGDSTGATLMNHADIRGFQFFHGVTQSGFTGAPALVLGAMQACVVKQISNYGAFNFEGTDSVQVSQLCFSNTFDDWVLFGWQRHGINFLAGSSGSTGNSWDNIYMNLTSGSTPQAAASGCYISVNAAVHDQHWKRLNMEWGSMATSGTSALINTAVPCYNWVFDTIHIEGIVWAGANPAVFNIYGDSFLVDSMLITSPKILSASLTGTPGVVYDWWGQASNVKINSVAFSQGQTSYQDTPLLLLVQNTAGGQGDVTVYSVDGGFVVGNAQFAGNLQFDSHLALNNANVLINKWGRYDFGTKGSTITKAVLNVSGAYSHYGQFQDAVIILAATGSYTINLLLTQGASGTQPVTTGNTVTFLRPTYTSGTVTIQNNGGALTTNSSTAAVFAQYNGSAWVTYTPVT